MNLTVTEFGKSVYVYNQKSGVLFLDSVYINTGLSTEPRPHTMKRQTYH